MLVIDIPIKERLLRQATWKRRVKVYLGYCFQLARTDLKKEAKERGWDYPDMAAPGVFTWRPFLLLLDLAVSLEEIDRSALLLGLAGIKDQRVYLYPGYVEYYRETMIRWPEPKDILEAARIMGAPEFPHLNRIFAENPAAPRAFIRGATFCEEGVDTGTGPMAATARLVERVLAKRAGGKNEVTLKHYLKKFGGEYHGRYKTSYYPIHYEYPPEQVIAKRLASYTQLPVESLRSVIFPGLTSSSSGGIYADRGGDFNLATFSFR